MKDMTCKKEILKNNNYLYNKIKTIGKKTTTLEN